MLAKINHHFSVCRIALLTLALVLTSLGMIPRATASCSPGQTRTIVVSIECCNYPYTWVTKQNQVCCTDGTWMNNGSPYCGSSSHCAF
jgi:hypothetical protein